MCGLALKNLCIFNMLKWRSSLPFCDQCKSMGNFKVDFHILRPHLDKIPMNIPKPMFVETVEIFNIANLVLAPVAGSSDVYRVELNVPSGDVVDLLLQVPLGPSDPTVMPNSLDVSNKVPIIDIPLSPISNDALIDLGLVNQKLDLHSNKNPIDHFDWLVNCDLSSNGGFGKGNDGLGNGSREVYDLNVVQVANEGFSNVVGKKRRNKKTTKR
ncbi:hypothetical protein IEQ34_011741 [Dendrobium chrysotoxum]|uniref:Uncharacterized protein n=1 Tax=Dendrobium chrysotoxum TaxID=161865 RepID=A0AAV7GTR3_DENCH|nr:hypothetical protein IEQ34_011741 [Dendrobium chrysotoxum]